MMWPALVAALALAQVSPGTAARGVPSAAARAYAEGDFENALRQLDAALSKASDDPSRADLQLARGECLAAMGRYASAGAAFRLALDANPDASLDPVRVAPSTVALLDRLKDVLRGELEVVALGASSIQVDGEPWAHPRPVRIGKHRVRVTWPGAEPSERVVVVRPERRSSARFEAPPPPPRLTPDVRAPPERLRPGIHAAILTDFRGSVSPQVGLGAEWRGLRVELSVLLGAQPALNLRAGLFWRDLLGPFGAYAALDGVMFFTQPVAFGGGGAVGVSVTATRWLEPFAEVRVQAFGAPSEFRRVYVLGAAGLRATWPR